MHIRGLAWSEHRPPSPSSVGGEANIHRSPSVQMGTDMLSTTHRLGIEIIPRRGAFLVC